MDHVRIILAIVLSFAVFLLWDLFFAPKPPVTPPAEKTQTDVAPETPPPEGKPFVAEQPAEKTTAIPEAVATPMEMTAGRDIRVVTDHYRATLTENGAAFKSVVLKGYREAVSDESTFKELLPENAPVLNGQIGFDQKTIPGIENARFVADVKDGDISIGDTPQTVTFTWTSTNGVVVDKKYRFSKDSYMIQCEVVIKNGSNGPVNDRIYVSLINPFSKDQAVYGFVGPSALIDGDVKKVKPKKVTDKPLHTGNIDWVANQDRYFLRAILPQSQAEASMRLFDRGEDLIENQYLAPQITVPAGTQKAMSYQFFFGPKSMRVLKGYDNSLRRVVDFGTFDFLARPCLWLMNFIYDHAIPNYGVAIIILTLITKIILWPLGTKSYKSMSDMKKVQPLIQEIRDKYKDDKKKMNEETMALYRTYKINPLGGCLPMLVQIPVFFALYRMLYSAIELRHAPFFLWIDDLSAPDRLFRFDFSVPFMHEPYGIPVLTLIMGATMLLQQKMSPPMGDPTQRKMMMLMPIVFTVVFINFPAGLVTYWLVNNVVSIGQQYYIQKKTA